MSQVTMTHTERQAALERLGYNEREARFLSLAALHGGYFLRRQYARFLGVQDGGNVTQLIEKVLNQNHAEAATYKANMHIYHLSARPFYAALGQEDNRNRRRKEAVTIKAKLMGLDFVLDDPDREYLATEREKITFFVNDLGVDRLRLPAKRYAGRGQVTERYFVEKYPIYYAASLEPMGPPVVSFCYVDPGQASTDGLETFLARYAPLLTCLRRVQLIYVAASSVLFAKAQSAFERFSGAGSTPQNSRRGAELSEYFEARRLYESRQFESFNRAKLLRLRDLRHAFSGPEIEAQYARWTAGKETALVTDLIETKAPAAARPGAFSTYLLDYSYDLFGSLTTH